MYSIFRLIDEDENSETNNLINRLKAGDSYYFIREEIFQNYQYYQLFDIKLFFTAEIAE